MARPRFRIAVGAAAVVAQSCIGVATVAAASVGCGQVVTVDTVLDADVGPCPDLGLRVEHGVTLDLGGHSVIGTGRSTGLLAVTGAGVRIMNGTVRGFGTGVEFGFGTLSEGASISGMSITGNATDGLRILGAQNVTIASNQIVANGGTGILLTGTYSPGLGASHNVVTANSVDGNGGGGISISGFPRNNVVNGNRVAGNGDAGVVLGLFPFDNRITDNVVVSNGSRSGVGDGIVVGDLGASNSVAANIVMYNAGDGIHLEGPGNNDVQSNGTGGNGSALPAGAAFDLHDSSPDASCDSNRWSANTFSTAFPPCAAGL